MGQPVSGYEWKRVIAAGSATLHDGATVLHMVTPQASTGTVTIYDSASGTSSNIVAVVGGGPLTNGPALEFDAQLKRGCYYLATGTPIVTITLG